MTYKKRKVLGNHPEYIKYNINLDVIVGVLTGRQVEPEGPRPGGAGGSEAPPARRGVVQGDGGVSATEVAGVQWAGRPGLNSLTPARLIYFPSQQPWSKTANYKLPLLNGSFIYRNTLI